jgi:hypothetical protein
VHPTYHGEVRGTTILRDDAVHAAAHLSPLAHVDTRPGVANPSYRPSSRDTTAASAAREEENVRLGVCRRRWCRRFLRTTPQPTSVIEAMHIRMVQMRSEEKEDMR